VLGCCREKGVTPIVTLHHFSSPKWLILKGGWENEKTIDYFAAYCEYVVRMLGADMEYVCTINEANMGLQLAKIVKERSQGQVQVGINSDFAETMKTRMASLSAAFGGMDPAKINTFLTRRTDEGDRLIMKAHEKARDAIKAACPRLKVGLTLSLHDFQAQKGGEARVDEENDEELFHYLPCLAKDDFIGVQNYSRKLIGPEGSLPYPEGAELTQAGYEFYPAALANVIRLVHKHITIPIIVTENGIAAKDDTRRVAFIKEALAGVRACIDDGIPVTGYMHWSLLDNFEWMQGFEPRFGLIAVDRTTQKRSPKESLSYLGSFSNSTNAKNKI
jgi:beta-glucosidase